MSRRAAPRLLQVRAGDHDWAVHEWAGESPSVFLIHATGFHARCWDAVVAGLGRQHVLAIDLPGHGHSGRWPPPYDWMAFGDGLVELSHQLNLGAVLGAGHSIGGFLLTWLASRRADFFDRILLFDPVIPDPGENAVADVSFQRMIDAVARRRAHWDSPQAMIDAFAPREPFNAWEPSVLVDYCHHALHPAVDGDHWELACPGPIEAEFYRAEAAGRIYQAIAGISVPVTVIRAREAVAEAAEFDFRDSTADAHLARKFPRGHDEYWPQQTHFIPMEAPGRVATRLLRELRMIN